MTTVELIHAALATVQDPELELGVRDDDPALQRDQRTGLVQRQAGVADLLCQRKTDDFDRALVRDVLVVFTGLGLGRRRGQAHQAYPDLTTE